MDKPVYLAKSDLYDADYDIILRNKENEFPYGYHYHDFYECCLYLGDAGVFIINGEKYSVRKGDIVLIDVFQPHTLLYDKTLSYERFALSINLSLLISFSSRDSNLLDIFFHSGGRHPIFRLPEESIGKYIRLVDLYRSFHVSQGRDILEKALAHMFLAYVYNDCYEKQTVSAKDVQHARILAQLFKYIERHLSEEITLAQLAEEVSYSECYVSRLFKNVTGKNLVSYIQEKRIGEAAVMIRGNVPINEAAERVGFNNYSYFYKTFKKVFAVSPVEYREQYLSGNLAAARG